MTIDQSDNLDHLNLEHITALYDTAQGTHYGNILDSVDMPLEDGCENLREHFNNIIQTQEHGKPSHSKLLYISTTMHIFHDIMGYIGNGGKIREFRYDKLYDFLEMPLSKGFEAYKAHLIKGIRSDEDGTCNPDDLMRAHASLETFGIIRMHLDKKGTK